jgi:predicted GIY-YIG superfamily endonuclease
MTDMAKSKKQYGVIYRLVHPVTLKTVYIGQTIHPQRRYEGHLKNTKNPGLIALNEECMKLKKFPYLFQLERCKRESLNEREQHWIQHYQKTGAVLLNSQCQEKSIIIYALCDPRNGAVRYIGSSKDFPTRIAQHIQRAKRGNCPRQLMAFLDELRGLKLEPTILLLEQYRDLEGNYWITKYESLGAKLTNSKLACTKKRLRS